MREAWVRSVLSQRLYKWNKECASCQSFKQMVDTWGFRTVMDIASEDRLITLRVMLEIMHGQLWSFNSLQARSHTQVEQAHIVLSEMMRGRDYGPRLAYWYQDVAHYDYVTMTIVQGWVDWGRVYGILEKELELPLIGD